VASHAGDEAPAELAAAVGGDETECGLGFADVTPPSSFITFVQSFNFESSFFFYFYASVVFGLPYA
jgi:hypothetical protein